MQQRIPIVAIPLVDTDVAIGSLRLFEDVRLLPPEVYMQFLTDDRYSMKQSVNHVHTVRVIRDDERKKYDHDEDERHVQTT